MAIDKRRTKPWLKAVIIVVAGLMVVSVLMSPFLGAFNSGGQVAPQTGQQPGAQETTASVTAKYQPTAQATEQKLQADPKNYDLLVQQGNTYFDWALGMQQAGGPQAAGLDVPIWAQSATYYQRALAVKPGDQKVITDYSVALFSSGQIDQAIKEIEGVIERDPKFAQAYFNAGIYYSASARHKDAITAMQTYLKLDPSGSVGSPQTANSIIQQSQQGYTMAAADHAGYDASAIVLIKVENNHWKLVK